MRRKYIGFIIIAFSVFLNITNVSAQSCANIEKEVDNYYKIVDRLSSIDCSKTEDSKIVNECNDLNLQKNVSLNELFRAEEHGIDCNNTKEKVKVIIKDNERNCGKVFNSTIDDMINFVMAIFYVVGPILLILFGTLDFSKATISSDAQALKKASNKFFKRLLATLALFLSPLLTRIILSFNTSGEFLTGDSYACDYNSIRTKVNYNITYVPKSETSEKRAYTSSNSGDFLSWKQYEGDWKNIQIGCGNVGKCGCLVTSVSIQVANAGAATTSTFTPSTFINTIKRSGGFTTGGAFTWTGWSSIAPNFEYKGQRTLTGDIEKKAKLLKNYIEQGYFPVAEVKKPNCGQHWVAIIGVEGSKIIMADPGSTSTNLTSSKYPCFASGSNQVALFKLKE